MALICSTKKMFLTAHGSTFLLTQEINGSTGESYSADRSVLDWKLLGDFLNLKVVVSDVMSPKYPYLS